MKRVTLVRPRRNYVQASIQTRKKSGTGVGGIYPPNGGVIYPTPQPGTEQANKEARVTVILGLAEELSPAQRKELLAKLALDESHAQIEKVRDVEMWSQAVTEALQTTGGPAGISGAGPAVIKRTVGSYAAWAPVANFMETSKLGNLTVTERQSVYMLLASMVVENARRIAYRSGIPLSAKLVGNCSGNISGLFDNAFPGYLESGLAMIVARRLVAQKLN